ncbi:MAG: hypothetical protein LBN74_10170, partial [Prevotella sp.]|nr:hypothetical protein [Prevotella sp.]
MMYFYQPLCPGQDFFFHYRRLQALMDGLTDSPYLIYLDYDAIDGYGYFTKAFYPDFILIPFALIGNLTSAAFAYQFMIFTMTVLCGVFTYVTVNTVYKNTYAAAIGALLFTFAVYRLLDIYHRAAIGEALSFTFVPLVFLGLYQVIKGNYKKWYILTIGFSLMIFTHLISSVLMAVTMMVFVLIYYKSFVKEPKRIGYLVLAGLAAIIITGYYIFPMMEQMLSDTFYYESRNLMSKAQDSTLGLHWIIWGMFTGIIIPEQALIPGVGLSLTCAIALRLFVYEKSPRLKSIDRGVIIGLCYIVACLPIFPWSVFPFSLLNFIQLPWRLLEFSCFFFAIAGGYYLSQLLRTNKRLFVGGIVVVAAIALVFANDAKMYQKYRCGRAITQEAAIGNDYHLGGMEYVPERVPSIEYIHQRGDSVKALNAAVSIDDFKKAGGVTSFDLRINNPDSLELPLIYYKGYTASLNGKELPVSESENGLVQVAVDRSGRVEAYYKGTFVQKMGFCITIITILGLCTFI